MKTDKVRFDLANFPVQKGPRARKTNKVRLELGKQPKLGLTWPIWQIKKALDKVLLGQFLDSKGPRAWKRKKS